MDSNTFIMELNKVLKSEFVNIDEDLSKVAELAPNPNDPLSVLDIVEEECSELIQQCTKVQRGKSSIGHLLEETADVIICIEILKYVAKITDSEIDAAVRVKLDRCLENIKENGYLK